MPRLALYLLGPPHVEYDGAPVKFNTRKTLALLAYLAVSRQRHRRDSLVNLLWPESSQIRGRALLRNSLSSLRKILEESWIEADWETVALNSRGDLWLDLDRLHQLLAECEAHEHNSAETCHRCLKSLSEAMDLYQGDFLTGFTLKDSINFDEWQRMQSQNLIADINDGFDRLIRCLKDEGILQKAIGYAQRWLESDKINEAAHRYLIDLYARSGKRVAALNQFRICKKILHEELGVGPDNETLQLYEAIKTEQIRPYQRSIVDQRPHNLPRQLTSFIGREDEIEEIQQIMQSTSLLTLTGSGGCGKTRLAVEAADNLAGEFVDGIWFVALGSLSDPSHIPLAVASALSLHPHSEHAITETLSSYLSSKSTLIVLDNCEHLVPGCSSFVGILLDLCPNLSILATSREPLHIQGEQEFFVKPLGIPPDIFLSDILAASTRRQPVEQLKRYDAVRLYAERAAAVLPRFSITEKNALPVAEICIHLDGLPLAIELTAARIRVLPPEELIKHLDHRLSYVKGTRRDLPVRQQTLRNEINWSYELLVESEKKVFSRLSVFAGGCSREAAAKICAFDDPKKEALEVLASLVDKSLLQCQHLDDETHFSMLETIKEFAGEQLEKTGETEKIRNRHGRFYLAFAENAEVGLHGPDQLRWLSRMEREYGNLRAALTFLHSSGKPSEGLRMVSALGYFWIRRGYFDEGNRWIDAFLQRSAKPTREEAKALHWKSWIYYCLGDNSAALDFSRLSYEMAVKGTHLSDTALFLAWTGFLERIQGSYDAGWGHGQQAIGTALENKNAWTIVQSLYYTYTQPVPRKPKEIDSDRIRVWFEDAIRQLHSEGDLWGIAIGRHGLADMLRDHFGLAEEACPHYLESLALFRRLNDRWMTANTLRCLGTAELMRDNLKEAEQCLRESLLLLDETAAHGLVTTLLGLFGQLAERGGDHGRSACLYGSRSKISNMLSETMSPRLQKRDRERRKEYEAYGPEVAKQWERGQSMSIREAIAYALEG